ncbi:50S ribosomal protein L5 [Durusdinium trenchii]|uniref:50S ribosomal protein L5 n=1 Tax=Durusdinium trenchii TaxID=1381693 RepID=A0ABP0MRT5_9DINO
MELQALGGLPKESKRKWMEPRLYSEKASMRRSRFGAGVAICALAFIANQFGGTPLFVSSPAGAISQTQARADSLVIRLAEAKPGKKPDDSQVAAVPVMKTRVKIGKNKYTIGMQGSRKEEKTRWLRSLKGKFVYRGPKPYDPDRFTKVSISITLDPKQASNTKIMNQVIEEARRISGQHPSVITFNTNDAQQGIRKGDKCGVKVNLEGQLMQDFLYRLNTIVLPRVRDFQGHAFHPFAKIPFDHSTSSQLNMKDALILFKARCFEAHDGLWFSLQRTSSSLS